ncbi:MAG: NAD(P)-binding domain-containing protein [Flavobacteriales bacterium]|nr:NAD(P)-binding domain-containing protein [Flavobacteriales bacterium]
MNKQTIIGVVGSGAMGSGIAQVAATQGHQVMVVDKQPEILENAKVKLNAVLNRLVEKGKISSDEAAEIEGRITWVTNIDELESCGFVIEAVVEDLNVKQAIFKQLDVIVAPGAILASNTSSLSITSIAASCEKPERVIGVHFFNPAPLMPLVEIIPAVQTDPEVVAETKTLVDSWAKTTVLARDTPGFIVNRIARPFYGEAIRIYEEGVAEYAAIDHALRTKGGFRMGPFELMDFIGNDVNYAVTETVFREFFYDPRYKPSFTQKRMVEAKRLGRKSGKGYYDYSNGRLVPDVVVDDALSTSITERVVAMLMNEAIDALFLGVASRDDLDLAMTKGVNYPKGLLRWADEWGLEKVLDILEKLHHEYGEDRYRPSPLLRRMAANKQTFYP